MQSPEDVIRPANLWRRLAAMLYDSLLLVAWIFIPWVLIFMVAERTYDGPVFQAMVYLQIGFFFTYFWRLKGQTLGMQVWKIKTISDDGEMLTLEECAVRFFFATFSFALMGFGFLWILFDTENLAWHDRASGTKVVFLGKYAYKNNHN